jgi:hypothetical protein
MKIAQIAHKPVPTTEAQSPSEMKEAPVTVVEQGGEEKPLPPQTYARLTPEPAPVEAAPSPEAPQIPSELPRTATPYPLFALAGAAALIAGLGLRRLVSPR